MRQKTKSVHRARGKLILYSTATKPIAVSLYQIIDKMQILRSTAVEFTPAQKINKLVPYR